MSHNQAHQSILMRTVRKYLASGFVIFSFASYAAHERVANPGGSGTGTPVPAVTQPAPVVAQALPTTTMVPTHRVPPTASLPVPTATELVVATQRPRSLARTVIPTATDQPLPPTATSAPAVAALYKDGQYTGPVVDAYWGNVQVAATIQNGRLQDVQFLEYPRDRRTSARINSVAVPYLTTESLQAQSADVDLITGATLTSRAFVMSLNSALREARAQS